LDDGEQLALGPLDADGARGDAAPPPGTPGSIELGFRPDVEGLRAVAVLLVVLCHAGVSWLRGGFVGVDVFFVISGYLITGLLLREHETRGRISYAGFYARRVRRILPAAMLVIVVTLLIAHHFQNAFSYDSQYLDEAKWAAMFVANLHYGFIQANYFSSGNLTASPFLHFWSLAVEEQFYVVWPTLVIIAGLVLRRWLRPTVFVLAIGASVASFAYSVHLVDTNLIWAYYSPFSRAWELGAGAIAATLAHPTARLPRWVGVVVAWAGLGAIAYAAATFTASTSFPGVEALWPVLGALGVIVGGGSGLGAGWLLNLTPVRAIGRVSYGWYLLHYPPMILWTGISPPGSLQDVSGLPVHERLLIAAITLAAAFVMYYVLERPIRRSRFLARRPMFSIAMGLSLVGGTFLLAVLYQKPYP
jgi:peptidoglycan/LPS O-acetylase OafA/YrhL